MRAEVDAVDLDPDGAQPAPQPRHGLVDARDREQPAADARLVRHHDQREPGRLESAQRLRDAREQLQLVRIRQVSDLADQRAVAVEEHRRTGRQAALTRQRTLARALEHLGVAVRGIGTFGGRLVGPQGETFEIEAERLFLEAGPVFGIDEALTVEARPHQALERAPLRHARVLEGHHLTESARVPAEHRGAQRSAGVAHDHVGGPRPQLAIALDHAHVLHSLRRERPPPQHFVSPRREPGRRRQESAPGRAAALGHHQNPHAAIRS